MTGYEIKQGKSIITGDGSMIYVPSPSICPFSVYPYHWSFEIATSVVAENKYKLEHFLGNQVFLSCETAKLKKPTASAGCIYVEIDFPHADGVYYSDYEQFCKKKYYDPDNKILAIIGPMIIVEESNIDKIELAFVIWLVSTT